RSPLAPGIVVRSTPRWKKRSPAVLSTTRTTSSSIGCSDASRCKAPFMAGLPTTRCSSSSFIRLTSCGSNRSCGSSTRCSRPFEAAEKEPSLFDLIEGWLERTPFLNFGDFDFWREYRRAVDAMLAADRASIRSNPTLTEDEKATQLAGVEATARRFADLFEQGVG